MSATFIILTLLLIGYSIFVVVVLAVLIHLLVTIWRTPKNIAESIRVWQDYRARKRLFKDAVKAHGLGDATPSSHGT